MIDELFRNPFTHPLEASGGGLSPLGGGSAFSLDPVNSGFNPFSPKARPQTPTSAGVQGDLGNVPNPEGGPTPEEQEFEARLKLEDPFTQARLRRRRSLGGMSEKRWDRWVKMSDDRNIGQAKRKGELEKIRKRIGR